MTTPQPPARAPRICEWCDNVDDPALGHPCPCRAYRERTATPTTPGARATRPYRPRAEPSTRPTAVPVPTLAERRAAYAPISEVITAVVAERKDDRKEGAA